MSALPLPHLPVEPIFDEAVARSGGRRVDSIIPQNPTFENADYYFETDSVITKLKEISYDANRDEELRDKIGSLYGECMKKQLVPPL